MKKRILSCVLILALFLPTVAVFAAPAVDTISHSLKKGDSITITASEFKGALDDVDEPTFDEDVLYVSLDEIPTGVRATVTEDEATEEVAADEDIELAVTGGITFTLLEDAPETRDDTTPEVITISYEAVTDPGDQDGVGRVSYPGEIALTVLEDDGDDDDEFELEARDLSFAKILPGQSVSIVLGVATAPSAESGITLDYTVDLDAVNQDLKGTLTKNVAADDDVTYTYSASAPGEDSFTYTVTAYEGETEIDTDTGTVTISVLSMMTYRDTRMDEHWVNISAGSLMSLGLLVGEKAGGENFFYPEESITRGEFVIWACGVFGIEPDEVLRTEFSDTDIPTWMRGYLSAAAEEGLIAGTTNVVGEGGTRLFKPNDQITKAQAIKLIANGLKITTFSGTVADDFSDYDDIPEWAANEVQILLDFGIIRGNADGSLSPNKHLTRAESAELLFQTYKYRNMVVIEDNATPEA